MGAWTEQTNGGQAVAPTNQNVIPLGMSQQNKSVLASDQLSRLMLLVAGERDRKAFALLFGHLAPRLKSFFMKSGSTGPAAEELVQETMLLLWRNAAQFDPARASVPTWVYTIARNQRIDALRRERRQALVSSETGPVDSSESAQSGEAALLIGERSERVHHALNGLSQEQARIVRLSFFADKPHAEIARELRIPLGTVKSRMRAAISRLRQLLDHAP